MWLIVAIALVVAAGLSAGVALGDATTTTPVSAAYGYEHPDAFVRAVDSGWQLAASSGLSNGGRLRSDLLPARFLERAGVAAKAELPAMVASGRAAQGISGATTTIHLQDMHDVGCAPGCAPHELVRL